MTPDTAVTATMTLVKTPVSDNDTAGSNACRRSDNDACIAPSNDATSSDHGLTSGLVELLREDGDIS